MTLNYTCGILADKRYLNHETGPHVESPQRLRVIYDMLAEEGIEEKTIAIKAREATEKEILLNHTPSYLHRTKNMGAGYLDADTVLSELSYQTALLAAGGCLNMVDAIMEEKISRGFAFVRPPGHHAESDRGMGFCLFNNIAIAARYLIKKHPLKKIAILDWDLHHGNGTQHSFYNEKEVLYLSIHQSPCYPGTGSIQEVGEGEGEGFTVNIPIPAGAGDAEYIKAFQALFIPVIENYAPEIILVSAGFDSHQDDPLGGMNVTSQGFGEMGKLLIHLADRVCHGKIGFFLEGGYSLHGLKESAREVIKALLTRKKERHLFSANKSEIDTILQRVKSVHQSYWPSL